MYMNSSCRLIHLVKQAWMPIFPSPYLKSVWFIKPCIRVQSEL